MINEQAIVCKGVTKSFGSFTALKAADLSISKGSIHALVGQNGAGKSTFLGVLAGRLSRSAGDIEVFGQPVHFSSPRQSKDAGIVAIYQELSIVPEMSAVDNMFLGQIISSRGLVKRREMRQQFQAMSQRLRVTVAPEERAGALSTADQQILEIMRAIHSNAQIILLDEPTASLAPAERGALFNLMRDLRASGNTMILVSHNLDEVLDISDDITVFRNGAIVDSRPKSSWDKAGLVSSMLGKEVDDVYRRRGAKIQTPDREPRLSVRNLTVEGGVHDISFDVMPGEILGIGGLVGSGRTTLLRALGGAEATAKGKLTLNGRAVPWPLTIRASNKLGIGLVPEDRKTQGVFLQMSATENIVINKLGACARHGVISSEVMRTKAAVAARQFYFDVGRLRDPVGSLSGGNQQKALLSRWWNYRPDILLIDEPTRGIDIGAKAEILDCLREMADQGVSIIMVSSELEEIVALADRVVVLAHGEKVAELPGETSTVASILHSAFRVENHHAQ